MSDLGNLLQMIYDLLSGWLSSFASYATDVMEKLNLIEDDTDTIVSNTSDIADDTNDIKDNTGAIITPVQSIKTNTDSIKNDTTNIKNNVTTMSNQLGTISTNVGTASAFTEDVANNTLDIKDRIVTIGSDTTQLRSNSNTITSDVSDIKQALGYYLANTPVTEDVEGSICNFDTDLTDYLQACKVIIPADLTGFSGITLFKNGKNLLDSSLYYQQSVNQLILGQTTNTNTYGLLLKKGTYTVSCSISKTVFLYYKNSNGNIVNLGASDATRTFTLTEDILLNFYVYTTQGILPSDISWIQIECSDTVSEYEPYKIMTYPVSFGTTITDGAEINLLDGLIKVNSTPVSYLSITPISVRTYKGINNIYSDVGTTALTYRETLKHYLDKQEA